MPIKSPFNFVPLAPQVFYPDWAQYVSHDVPFEDGVSGLIELSFKAETPIFVRNASASGQTDNSFSHVNVGDEIRHFIPATTVKGAIKNVLKIMSFGKMQIDKRARYAQREWSNPSLYPLKGNADELSKIKCGWLVFDPSTRSYKIRQSKKMYRIALPWIGEKFDCGFKSYFSKDVSDRIRGFDLNKEYTYNGKKYDPKTAVFKYDLLQSQDYLREHSFSKYSSERVKFDQNGDIRGYLIMTGQSAYTEWVSCEELEDPASIHKRSKQNPDDTHKKKIFGKFYEFVFDAEIINTFDVSEDLFEQYDLYMYKDNSDWEFAKKQLNGLGMPVFFRIHAKAVKDFGLAYLYKLPYDHSPLEIARKNEPKWDTDPDLAELMFGYVNPVNKSHKLKGRVQFGHFWGENCLEGPQLTLTLNSPKPSYYPIYIVQDAMDSGRFKTYNDGMISGWKRYVLRDGYWTKSTSENLDSVLMTLDSGSIFKGDVYFHNLRPVELGALLSSLTFHGATMSSVQPTTFHQIGQGKPYGLGRVSVNDIKVVVDGSALSADKIDEYMMDFEIAMNARVPDWRNTTTIKELMALSTTVVQAADSRFKYMEMAMQPGSNEFLIAKGGANGKGPKSSLTPFSQIVPPVNDFGMLSDAKLRALSYKKLIYAAKECLDAKEYAKAVNIYSEAKNYSDDPDSVNVMIAEVRSAERKATYEELISAAKECLDAKEYIKAVELYSEAQKYSDDPESVNVMIAEVSQVANSAAKGPEKTFEQLIAGLSDFKGLSQQILKWKNNHGAMEPEQVAALKARIVEIFRTNKKDKKAMADVRTWERFFGAILGNEVVKELFDSVALK